MSSSEIIAHIDGGSRGNPGPAAYGVAVKTPQGEPVTAFAKFLGKTTNNFAEYQGLLAALDYALRSGYSRLRVFTDSELMARQISGQYKVRSPDLKPLYEQARGMIQRLESFSIRHVYREQNREADKLANQAMDAAERGGLPEPHGGPAGAPASKGLKESPPPAPAHTAPPKARPVKATYHQGALHPHTQLPLLDGEEVELKIRRRK